MDGEAERRLEAGPGDYVFVPPWVPHREENPDSETEAVVVIARNTQEAIVVNVDGLDDPIALPSMVDTLVAARAALATTAPAAPAPATAVRLDAVGHYPMVEAPARFLAAVLPALT